MSYVIEGEFGFKRFKCSSYILQTPQIFFFISIEFKRDGVRKNVYLPSRQSFTVS
jgi:hypothetical protein